MGTKGDQSILRFETPEEWEAWLEEHHDSMDGVWIEFAKKSSGLSTLSYVEAVEGALCFGWIDGQAQGVDDQIWRQRFTPRRRKSKWSAINRERAARLAEQGRLRPAGLREVEAAKEDGRWDQAYASPSTMTVPADLQVQLDGNPAAKAYFEALNSTNRYAILYRILDARKPETRARRIEKFVAMLAEGRKLY